MIRDLLASLRADFWVVLLGVSGVVTVVVGLVMRRLSPAPGAMIELELAGTIERADALLAKWGPGSAVRLAAAVGLDYVFLVAYGVFLGGLAWWASSVATAGWIRVVLQVLAVAQVIAAGLDAIENCGLLRYLVGDRRAGWLRVARLAALVKFSLVLGGILWISPGLRRAARS